MKKRRVLTIALALCLVAIMAFGSLAYFTQSKNISNKFMTAAYDPENPDKPVNPDDLFSITVTEPDAVEAAKTDDDITTNDDGGHTYKNLNPGQTVTKDPTVKNTGKYDQWVRVSVTVTKAAEWKAICAANNITDLTAIFNDFDSSKWTLAEKKEDTTANTLTYTYYLNSKLAADQTATLFKSVTLPASLTAEQFASIAEFELNVAADAIQADNNGTTAAAGFVNF